MRIPAYAKINLFLDVNGLRDDGFHTIKSVMHSVTLCDFVSAERSILGKKNISITVSGNEINDIPNGKENLIYKAAMAFFEHYSISDYSVNFTVEKHIPVSAGLAGGSTDAAATLRLLSVMYGTNEKELYAVAEKIGSDIPFCLMGGTCVADGKGEILTPIENDAVFDFVICKAGDGISTPAAYRSLDEKFGKDINMQHRDSSDMIEAIYAADNRGISKNLYNIFEEVILPVHAESLLLRSLMIDEGAIGALLSGSGPSVFGIFSCAAEACRTADRLKSLGFNPLVCSSALKGGQV